MVLTAPSGKPEKRAADCPCADILDQSDHIAFMRRILKT
jgi:hypothetical protein